MDRGRFRQAARMSSPQWLATDHAKPCMNIVLAHQRHRIDQRRPVGLLGKARLERGAPNLPPRRRQRARKGHVEAELVEHIWITPAVEMRDLPRGQTRCEAPRTVGGRGWRTEWMKRSHAISRQPDRIG